VYSAAAVQLSVEVAPALLYEISERVPPFPLPVPVLAQYREPAVTAEVELIAFTPGVAGRPIENDVDGADVTRAKTAIVSPVTVPEGKAKVTVTVFVSPARKPVVPENEIAVGLRRVAFAGATHVIKPSPNAETTTSEIRLMSVFVDIDFLSLVAIETFSLASGKDCFFAL